MAVKDEDFDKLAKVIQVAMDLMEQRLLVRMEGATEHYIRQELRRNLHEEIRLVVKDLVREHVSVILDFKQQ